MEKVTEYLKSLVAPLLVLALLTFGVGKFLLTISTGDPGVSKELAEGRTSLWNDLTDLGSSLSDTPYIVALTALTAILFRLIFHRWRESIFMVLAVWSQSLVFLGTTTLVGRNRPSVEHLDPAPPTSSFPSGHVSAAVGFYCALALVLTLHNHRYKFLNVIIWTIGLAVPLIVSYSRLYRGMHYVTDVLWGLLLGAVCVIVVARAILFTAEGKRSRTPARERVPSP